MARLNEILVGRFARSLQKIFGQKGPVPVAAIAPEIMPVHFLQSGAEHRYLEGWNRFAFPASVAAVAAQNSSVRFRNPAGSNVVAVLEKLTVSEATADTIVVENQTGNTDLTVGGGGTRIDPRGNPTATVIVSTGNNVAAATALLAPIIQAGVMLDIIWTDIQEYQLLPGEQLQIRTAAVNVAMRVNAIWRERFLEESERT